MITLEEDIDFDTEYLDLESGETVGFISIENLLGILKRFKIDIKQARNDI